MKLSAYLVIGLIVTNSAFALTVSENKVAKHARAELKAAQNERDQAKADEAAASTDADNAQWWALDAENRAAEAQKASDEQHRQLVEAVKQNAEMRPIVEQCKKWWGIGAIIYGFKRLAIHLFILIAVLAVLAAALAWFFPPVLGLFRLVGGRLIAAGKLLVDKQRHKIEDKIESYETHPRSRRRTPNS